MPLTLAAAAMADSIGMCLLAMECVRGVIWFSPLKKTRPTAASAKHLKAVCLLWLCIDWLYATYVYYFTYTLL